MRHTNLALQLQANKHLNLQFQKNGVYRPAQQFSGFPWCAKCNTIVEAAGIEERGPDPDFPRWFEVRVECHGEEDYGRVEFRDRKSTRLNSSH